MTYKTNCQPGLLSQHQYLTMVFFQLCDNSWGNSHRGRVAFPKVQKASSIKARFGVEEFVSFTQLNIFEMTYKTNWETGLPIQHQYLQWCSSNFVVTVWGRLPFHLVVEPNRSQGLGCNLDLRWCQLSHFVSTEPPTLLWSWYLEAQFLSNGTSTPNPLLTPLTKSSPVNRQIQTLSPRLLLWQFTVEDLNRIVEEASSIKTRFGVEELDCPSPNIKIFGMNYKTNCDPGLLKLHQYLWSSNLVVTVWWRPVCVPSRLCLKVHKSSSVKTKFVGCGGTWETFTKPCPTPNFGMTYKTHCEQGLLNQPDLTNVPLVKRAEMIT